MNSEGIKAKAQSKQWFLPISDGTDRQIRPLFKPAFCFVVRSGALQSPVRGGLRAPRAAMVGWPCHILKAVRSQWMSIAPSSDRMTRQADV
jgi:hypothetical protein